MAAFLRKYGTGTGADVYIPIIKRDVVDYAVSADWTPAAGDVKISKDGGAAANIGTLPTAVTMGNTAMWKFVFTDAELQAAYISITISDSATKAVEDQFFAVETYGNASAMHAFDLDTATQNVNVSQISGDSVAADNLEAILDGTGGVTLVASAFTLTTPITANVTQLSGDGTAADNAEAFFDGTGYAGTNNVIPTVTTLTNLPSIPANWLTAAGLAADAVNELVDQVWRETIADHTGVSGSTAEALNAAGSAGDPWTTSLPGSYTGSQAGKMLSDILTDTAEIGSAGAGLTALATAAELAKVPKSDGTTSWNATALAAINAEVDTALADYDGPTNAEMVAAFTEIKGATWATTDTLEAIRDRGDAAWTTATGFSTHSAADVWAAATRTLTAIDEDSTTLDIDAAVAAAVTTSLTTALTEGYRGTGATGSVRDLLYELIAHMGESSITSTTKTLKKLDGSTTAKTYTLDDDTTPTSITEAT